MICRDISFSSPEENILFDELLLAQAEKGEGGEVLRFWESPKPFIVLGLIGKVDEDINVSEVLKDEVPVLRRFSGGGTVVQGPGCLNYSLVLSKESDPRLNDLTKSYQVIFEKILRALTLAGISAQFMPVSDLAMQGSLKKFSGNAQHRGRKFILHHGTILYHFDLSIISKYLLFPRQTPEYRAQRSHEHFVTNIPLSGDNIKQVLADSFQVKSCQPALSSPEQKLLAALIQSKPCRVTL